MPVSITLAGSGSSEPSALRLYCMNTRFQISMTRGLSLLTSEAPLTFFLLVFGTKIYVNLRTRSARTRITHFPKIIVFVTINNMVFGEKLAPVSRSFVVAFQTFGWRTFENGYIQIFFSILRTSTRYS